MYTKTKLIRSTVFLIAGLLLALAASPASTASTISMRAANGTTVTKIWVNGRHFDAFLVNNDVNAAGFINVSHNQITDTYALDFSYSEPHPTDPDISLIFQGAGEIPGSAVTMTETSAHLALTTPPSYFVNFCTYNTITFEAFCVPGEPLTFDLTWEADGLLTVFEKVQRVEMFGPVTTKIRAEFVQRTATVNGSWGAHTTSDMMGNLLDTQNKTFLREVILNATQ